MYLCQLNKLASCFFIFFFSFFAQLQAQKNSKNLTLIPELKGTAVQSVYEDRRGLLWIATQNGLYKYDGYEFKKFYFNPNDSTTLKILHIFVVYEDRNGHIWVGGVEGLYRYHIKSKKFKAYPYTHLVGKPVSNFTAVSTIAENIIGDLLLGVNSPAGDHMTKSLLYLDKKTDQIKLFPYPSELEPGGIYKISADKSGTLLIQGYHERNFKLDESNILKASNALAHIIKFDKTGVPFYERDQHDTAWYISQEGYLTNFAWTDSILSPRYSFKHLLPNPNRVFYALDIAFEKDEKVWLALDQGILYFDRKKRIFQSVDLELGIKSNGNYIFGLHVDSFGNLWICTGNGLYRYDHKSVVTTFGPDETDSTRSITGFVISPLQSITDGKIWMSHQSIELEQSGFLIMDPIDYTFKRIPFATFLPKGGYVISFAEQSPGEFYLSTNLGIYSFNTKTKSAKKISILGFPDNNPGITQFLQDKKGNHWLGSRNYLYKKLKSGDRFEAIDLSRMPGGDDKSNEISMLVEGQKLGLWILTANGLFLYDYTTEKIARHGYHSNAKLAFPTQEFTGLYEDDHGVAYVGTWQGGLIRYDVAQNKYKIYTIEDGLPGMSIQTIQPDDRAHALWIGTSEGISKFDLDNQTFNTLTAQDGVIGNAHYFAIKTTDHKLLYTGQGINILDPAEIKNNSIPPKVTILDIKVANQSIYSTSDNMGEGDISKDTLIQLRHDQNNISIDYLGIQLNNPLKTRYAYQLEGYDPEWKQVEVQRSAYYSNLPPGSYTFTVKAANSNGTWSDTFAKMHLVILPPWWKTKWAYVLYLLALAGLGSLANTYFKQRVIKKERERSQLKELEQAKEIEKAYVQLEQSHETLKNTQSQLVQAEKMASLGELTAGIAHEIQNPLNFVNNFSDINIELIEEMREELHADRKAEALMLADTIKTNLEKITNHGRRADSIVKGMLQHSRKNTGQKEPTNINALADEYLRLAYHGLRAKDKSFNATFKTDLDPSIGDVYAVPQDIGRVLLNLITNAFHAVTEEDQKIKGQNPESNYTPVVTVSTKKWLAGESEPSSADHVEIRITDNGPGIPSHLRDKIFQPFFTTKPTGLGTGLGLSLAYDIIKAHGGSIKVISNYRESGLLNDIGTIRDHGSGEGDSMPIKSEESKRSAGTEFVINLPTS